MKVDQLLKNPVQLAVALAIVAGAVYLIGRRAVSDVASAAGGLVSGDNALTQGTPYRGAGIPGTLGAATNTATGGLLGTFGSWLGGKLYEVTHPAYDPNAPIKQAPSADADERNWLERLSEVIR